MVFFKGLKSLLSSKHKKLYFLPPNYMFELLQVSNINPRDFFYSKKVLVGLKWARYFKFSEKYHKIRRAMSDFGGSDGKTTVSYYIQYLTSIFSKINSHIPSLKVLIPTLSHACLHPLKTILTRMKTFIKTKFNISDANIT